MFSYAFAWKRHENIVFYWLLHAKMHETQRFYRFSLDSMLGPTVVELWLVTDYKIYFFAGAPWKTKDHFVREMLMKTCDCYGRLCEKLMEAHVFSKFCMIPRCCNQKLWCYGWSQIIKFIFWVGAPWKTKDCVRALCFHSIWHESIWTPGDFTALCVKGQWEPFTVMDFCVRNLWSLALLLAFVWFLDCCDQTSWRCEWSQIITFILLGRPIPEN